MIYVLLGIIIALQLKPIHSFRIKKDKPVEAPVEATRMLDAQVAIASALFDVGLNVEDYNLNGDLKGSNKFGEIIFHAAKHMGMPLNTYADLHKFLVK